MFFRDLREIDIDDVIELCRNVYSGRDFVPKLIGGFIESNRVHPFGIFSDDEELLGIDCFREEHSSSVAWSLALRVKESARGQGIGKKLTNECVRRALERCSVFAYCTSSFITSAIGLARQTRPQLIVAGECCCERTKNRKDLLDFCSKNASEKSPHTSSFDDLSSRLMQLSESERFRLTHCRELVEGVPALMVNWALIWPNNEEELFYFLALEDQEKLVGWSVAKLADNQGERQTMSMTIFCLENISTYASLMFNQMQQFPSAEEFEILYDSLPLAEAHETNFDSIPEGLDIPHRAHVIGGDFPRRLREAGGLGRDADSDYQDATCILFCTRNPTG